MDASLKDRFSKQKWFHSIDFGDFASSGRFRPGSPQNITLFGFMDLVRQVDLRGADVLDIGATDGLASFGMKALGAQSVHATDSVDKPTFRAARDALGQDVEYHPNTQIKDLKHIFSPAQFDVILCAGVVYHMLNPSSAFTECRKLMRKGGLFFLETPYFSKGDSAAIYLNSETEMVPELYTYSVPTKAALLGLMKLSCFDVIAIRTISGPDRITILARAVEPDDVRGRTSLLRRIHEVDFCDYEFRLKDLSTNTQPSVVCFSGDSGEEAIDYKTFKPVFPFHPHPYKLTVGSTIWTTADGNR